MKNKEIEYKYWATNIDTWEFETTLRLALASRKELSGAYQDDGEVKEWTLEGESPEYVHVVSCDDYYEDKLLTEKTGVQFIRFRKGGAYQQLTLKRKTGIDNVVRDELNLDISNCSEGEISHFLSMLGYQKTFQVYKEAWIWFFNDCHISYYTLPDKRSVIELEAVNYETVEEGIAIIDKWEDCLRLDKLQKEKRSLFEIYKEEANKKVTNTTTMPRLGQFIGE